MLFKYLFSSAECKWREVYFIFSQHLGRKFNSQEVERQCSQCKLRTSCHQTTRAEVSPLFHP